MMKIKRFPVKHLGAISSFLAIALALAVGCDKKAAGPEIRIGVIQAQTGTYAAFGTGALFGVQAAVEDINKLGGVKVGNEHCPIRMVVVDSQSDPSKLEALADRLITQDKVHFLVKGNEPTPMHAGISQAAERHRIPFITSVGPYEPWLGQKKEARSDWNHTWATGAFAISTPAAPGDSRAKPGYTIMDTWVTMLEIFGEFTNRQIGIVVMDDPAGRGWYNLFAPALQNMGYTVAGADRHLGWVSPGTKDFSTIIKGMKDAKVDILWGNLPSPVFGAFWKQASELGFKPQMVSIGRAATEYSDIASWGGDLPQGIGTDMAWDPSMVNSPGFGETTPRSLADRWAKATGQPVNRGIGSGYRSVQVLVDAIQRAASVEPAKVNAALAATDLPTICHQVKFNDQHFSHSPLFFGQWMKTDKPEKWELRIIFSWHPAAAENAKPLFPLPR